jgi:type II secretory pathway pseudopilin PulG
MNRRILKHRLHARLHGERGFTFVETMVAIVIVFGTLVALASTVTSGFRYIGYSRNRIQATSYANRVLEDVSALPYASIKSGLSSTDAAGDPRIVDCAGVLRFESCSGAQLIVSTYSGGYTANRLVPHSGSETFRGLTFDWAVYVTNDAPSTEPYVLTVIVNWNGGSIPSAPNNLIRVQTKRWSPTGCVSSNLHPFAAPCQPFFYGLAQVPAGSINLGPVDIHQGAVDLAEASISLPGAETFGQQEQLTTQTNTAWVSGLSVTDSGGDTIVDGAETVVSTDSDIDSPASSVDGRVISGAGGYLERLNDPVTDPPGQIGLQFTVPAGDLGDANASASATSADAYACPPSGTRETDGLACAGSRIKQAGTITAAAPFTHVVAGLGSANVVRVVAPASYSTATVDRDAVTGYQGVVDVTASRTLGSIYLGGFPTSGMTPPTGMVATSTNDNNYCVRITGYSETVRVVAGERMTAPSNASPTGSISYYTGLGFTTRAVTDTATLAALSVTCQSTPQIISGKTVQWVVRVLPGGIVPASAPSYTETTDPADPSQTRFEAEATTTPLSVTVSYQLFVNSIPEMDMRITTDLGSLVARGVYGEPPPSQGGVST